MKLSHKAKKNFDEDNQFYIDLGKKLRAARKTKVNEFTGKETYFLDDFQEPEILSDEFNNAFKIELEKLQDSK
jgi:hypothetical protein